MGMFSRQAHPGNGTAARRSARRIDLTATAGPDATATSATPGATWNTPFVLPFAPQGAAQAEYDHQQLRGECEVFDRTGGLTLFFTGRVTTSSNPALRPGPSSGCTRRR
jgi:hypothetical protein